MPNSLQGSNGWGEGRVILYIKASLVQWKNIRLWRPEFEPEGKHFVSRNSFFFILGGAAKLRWAGGAQRPVGRGNEPKKTGARSARARTRGQNPLVKT